MPAEHSAAVGNSSFDPSHSIVVGPPNPELSDTLLLSGLSAAVTSSTDSAISTMQQRPPSPLPGTTGVSRQRKMRVPSPSLLYTTEFKLYYLLYLTVAPHMAYTMYQASSPTRSSYAEYENELSEGWMLGRKVDLSDGQWDTFRSNLLKFTMAMLGFVVLNRVARTLIPAKKSIYGVLPQLWLTCVFGTLFIMVLSGASIVFIAGLAWGNYFLAKRCAGRRWAPAVFWTYNMLMLFANEHYRGYSFESIAAPLAWLDEWRGILRRWDIMFNLSMLRMVSFAMDYHWRIQQEQKAGAERIDAMALQIDTARDRVERACFAGNYCFGNYWAYLLYPPLYLTGPIITFNDFVNQMRQPSPATSLRATALYGLRLVAAGLLMELVLHTVYCVAISKWAHWDEFSVYEISLLGYMRLTFIWLKLLIIWRFARFWAMVDGLETVENMRRCMSNNYSLQQFWRDWHCSYNRWLVRYVYIPLGGRKTSSWNTFVVFTFVALWHDLSLRLLEWAWIIALMFLPEALATWIFNRPQWKSKPYFRFICSAGGAINIVGMMIGNLVGFGDEGVDKMLRKIFSKEGALFLAITFVILNMHLQVMFELREHEYRKEYAAAAQNNQTNTPDQHSSTTHAKHK
ncbi:glycerol transporter [Coemansia sp. RSA 989]|nr:glycerol transporter [Coemansia mojavensis]KAJ1742873.1 glycerol transporter [Coemansia sp. RSA 1086]KAJ1749405.1 glycerol transporter [Coemansia sp. RSA 1821]KAJ1866046.1 glycerol transporter [Coemansia sp. RSA 989]KAJ1873296.1 glycerol transporter [Coemansia sp. RSA 990]KAJ2669972.1 glycerol transporter [Coemansia sp. RSA 1085]